MVIGLTRLGIKPKSEAPKTDAFTIRLYNSSRIVQIYSRDAEKYEKQTSKTKYTFTNLLKKR